MTNDQPDNKAAIFDHYGPVSTSGVTQESIVASSLYAQQFEHTRNLIAAIHAANDALYAENTALKLRIKELEG